MNEDPVQSLLETVHRTDLRELCSWLSHEFAQPLTAMASYVGAAIALLDTSGAEPSIAALRRSLAQIDRARDIVTRSRSRFPSEEATSFEVTACVEEALRALELPAHIIENSPNRPLPVIAPRNDVMTALVHLLRNAAEACSGQPAAGGRTGALKVRVSASADGSGTVVEISNPGDTDPEELWFEAFHTTKPNHLGIGLTVARQLTRRLSGTLEAQAPRPGEVAFRLELPHNPG